MSSEIIDVMISSAEILLKDNFFPMVDSDNYNSIQIPCSIEVLV